jgi:hypothetical protein
VVKAKVTGVATRGGRPISPQVVLEKMGLV